MTVNKYISKNRAGFDLSFICIFDMLLKIDLFCLQEIKKAILSDMTKLGKEAGLKSFEQVKLLFMFPQKTYVSPV